MKARATIAFSIAISVSTVLTFTTSAQAEFAAKTKTVRYKESPLHLESGDRLVISGLNAKVRLSPTQASDGLLKVSKSINENASPAALSQFDVESFAVRRTGNVVVIEQRGPDSKAKWEASLKEAIKTEFVFEVTANSVPTEIVVQEGAVNVSAWHEALTVGVVDGQFTSKDTAGPLRLQMQKGSATIVQHNGSAEVDSFGAKLSVTDLDGSLDLTNFGGDSQLLRIKGRVEMLAQAGATSIAGSSGTVEFVNGRGALNLSDFDGQVRGASNVGHLTLGLKGEAEVDVESDKGNIAVRLPANSGASLQLQTEEGGIVTPDEIQTELRSGFNGSVRKPNSTAIISGSLPGQGAKGRIAVRSKSGAIRIR